ncbi:L-rhamnose mutarotase [Leifsonia sp. LS-T14]|uniref:L-rhamnose mutarotase n=1 Tax=unclassified Leifsonia TaxID=2663824 RepID=UPI0035A6E494
MRVALHSILREGRESGYVDAHAAIPDDLVRSFARVGIHDWAIWRSGRDLFHLVDCDDFAAAMEALATDPANLRWQSFINQYVDHFVAAEGLGHIILHEVWALDEQRNS